MTEPALQVAPAAPAPGGLPEPLELPPRSPWGLFWGEFRKSHLGLVGTALLVVFYAVALLAPFVAP